MLSGKVYDRAKHVIEECARVIDSAKALKAGDILAFGEYLNQSHYSLRDLYEVTGAYLDALSARSREHSACIGSRMTGAGFGGCAIALVHRDAVAQLKETVGRQYESAVGYAPSFYVANIGNGAHWAGEVAGEA